MSLSLVVLLAIMLAPADASFPPPAGVPEQRDAFVKPQPLKKRSVPEEFPGDMRIARGQAWKRAGSSSEDTRHDHKMARPVASKPSTSESEDPRHDDKMARPMAWKRSTSHSDDPRHDYKMARPMAWKERSLYDSEDPRHDSKMARPMAWKRAVGSVPESAPFEQSARFVKNVRRAVGTVPDSSAGALDALKPMRRGSVFEKRAVGAVDVSNAKEPAEGARRLVARDNLGQLGQVETTRAD